MDDSQRLMMCHVCVYFYTSFYVCETVSVCVIISDRKCDIRKLSLCHIDIHFKPTIPEID